MTTLRQLAEAATPGEWANKETRVYLRNLGGFDIRNAPNAVANAAYIAAANPAAILALLDTIDRQEAINKTLHRIAKDGVKRQQRKIQELEATIDAQRKLLEQSLISFESMHFADIDKAVKDITTHLEATK